MLFFSRSSLIELDNFQGAFYERDPVDQEKEIDVSLLLDIVILIIITYVLTNISHDSVSRIARTSRTYFFYKENFRQGMITSIKPIYLLMMYKMTH